MVGVGVDQQHLQRGQRGIRAESVVQLAAQLSQRPRGGAANAQEERRPQRRASGRQLERSQIHRRLDGRRRRQRDSAESSAGYRLRVVPLVCQVLSAGTDDHSLLIQRFRLAFSARPLPIVIGLNGA